MFAIKNEIVQLTQLFEKLGENGYHYRSTGNVVSICGPERSYHVFIETDGNLLSIGSMVAKETKMEVVFDLNKTVFKVVISTKPGRKPDETIIARLTDPPHVPGYVPVFGSSPLTCIAFKSRDTHLKFIDAEAARSILDGFKKDLEYTLTLAKTKSFLYSLPYQFRVHRPAFDKDDDSSSYEDELEEGDSSSYQDSSLGLEIVKGIIKGRSSLRFAKFRLYELAPEAEAYLRETFICRSEGFKLYVIW